MNPEFEFRPLGEMDLPTLLGWFNAPHARRWFGGGCTLDELRDEHLPSIEGRTPTREFIALREGEPFGHVAWSRMGDFPEMQRAYRVEHPDAVNIDVIVGEPARAGRGDGPAMIRAFLDARVFDDPRVPLCVIDPYPDNAIAIRAYEKAGFTFDRALDDDTEGGCVYLMELRREEFFHPGPSPSLVVRPARVDEVALAESIDDDACALYEEHGLHIEVSGDPRFFSEEVAHWRACAARQQLLFACVGGEPVGFIALDVTERGAWLQQLSVRRAFMGRGIGRALLARAKRWSIGHGALWLTTWMDLPWNGPFYMREGFAREDDCGETLRAVLASERRALPRPAGRAAMVYRHEGGVER